MATGAGPDAGQTHPHRVARTEAPRMSRRLRFLPLTILGLVFGALAVPEFHIEKPDRWPAGKYRLELFLDRISAPACQFDVKAS
jgi:hypothetical protein